jgi:hypothetical protein
MVHFRTERMAVVLDTIAKQTGMSDVGTSRHFAAMPDTGRFWTEADMNWQQDRLRRSRMTRSGLLPLSDEA